MGGCLPIVCFSIQKSRLITSLPAVFLLISTEEEEEGRDLRAKASAKDFSAGGHATVT